MGCDAQQECPEGNVWGIVPGGVCLGEFSWGMSGWGLSWEISRVMSHRKCLEELSGVGNVWGTSVKNAPRVVQGICSATGNVYGEIVRSGTGNV